MFGAVLRSPWPEIHTVSDSFMQAAANSRTSRGLFSFQKSCRESLLSEQVSCTLAVSHTRTDCSGLYGLIVAKTYLQVSGGYDDDTSDNPEKPCLDDLPYPFATSEDKTLEGTRIHLLNTDDASGLGGTWNYDKLYHNLLSQNSYAMYKYSDFSMTSLVGHDEDSQNGQFIAGWKINPYLHAWSEKWFDKAHALQLEGESSLRYTTSRSLTVSGC